MKKPNNVEGSNGPKGAAGTSSDSPVVALFERLRKQRNTRQPGAFGKVKNRPTGNDMPYTHPRYVKNLP